MEPKKISLITQILSTLEEWRPKILEDLTWLVSQDRGSEDKESVDAGIQWMAAKLSSIGCQVTIYTDEKFGASVSGSLHSDGAGRILLIAHMDTVWPKGTVARWPLTIHGQIANGPGVVDNGAGSLAGYYALRVLKHLGYSDFDEITFVNNGDEELGSPFGRQVFFKQAEGKNAAFSLESPSNSDEFISERAGICTYRLSVKGKPAHTGVDPEVGANAVLEMAHKLIAMHQVSGEDNILKVNATRVNGGGIPVCVADNAWAEIDVRFKDRAEAALIERSFREIADQTFVRGTSASLEGGVEHFPMQRLPKSQELVTSAIEVGNVLGMVLKDVFCGGSSDASFTASAGVPSLCGLGPFGRLYHTREEYLDLSTLIPRMALVAGVIVAQTGEKGLTEDEANG